MCLWWGILLVVGSGTLHVGLYGGGYVVFKARKAELIEQPERLLGVAVVWLARAAAPAASLLIDARFLEVLERPAALWSASADLQEEQPLAACRLARSLAPLHPWFFGPSPAPILPFRAYASHLLHPCPC